MTTDAPLADGDRSVAIFLHANGFPTGCYRQFCERLAGRIVVDAPAVLDTPLHLPAGRRWGDMLEQVVRRIDAPSLAAPGKTLALVGHSMGGYLSIMAAALRPDRVGQIVLIDSPLVAGWRSLAFSGFKLTGLVRRGGPAPIAARRRDHWPSIAAARAHFESKAFVRRWAPGVLDDFLQAGLVRGPHGDVRLAIAREVESDIYAGLPAARVTRDFRKVRARGIVVDLVAGRDSVETRLAGRLHNQRVFGAHWHELPGGHLVPMESPRACADKVMDCLSGLDRGPSRAC